jgi:hypothetical protein
MNVPVIIDNEKYNFFIYINNFDLGKIKSNLDFNSDGMYYKKNNYKRNNDNFTNRFFQSVNINNDRDNFEGLLSNTDGYGNYASFQPEKSTNYNNLSSIMVVPFPVNPHTSASKIGLVDITTNDMKELRTDIKSLKPQPRSFGINKDRSYTLNSIPLEVHKIGNYNISVATSLDQLLERIDWTKFQKPDNFKERIQTFRNPTLYPPQHAYFYVVASAIENIKDDGFGVVYPQLEQHITYIPTAHEDTEYEPKFDVEIYNFGYGQNNSYYDKNYLHDKLKKLINQQVKMIYAQNSIKMMNYDKNISSFNFIEEKRRMKNHNIFLNNAS